MITCRYCAEPATTRVDGIDGIYCLECSDALATDDGTTPKRAMDSTCHTCGDAHYYGETACVQ